MTFPPLRPRATAAAFFRGVFHSNATMMRSGTRKVGVDDPLDMPWRIGTNDLSIQPRIQYWFSLSAYGRRSLRWYDPSSLARETVRYGLCLLSDDETVGRIIRWLDVIEHALTEVSREAGLD